jgi:protein disulfide-isomerase A6
MPFALFFALSASVQLEITPENIETIVGGPRPAFVKFYSRNCRACQSIALHYSSAADLIPSVTFGSIDCDREQSLCEAFNVTSYPSLVLFPTGETEGIKFAGDRSWQGFCTFLTANTEFKCREPIELIVSVDPRRLDRLTEEKKCLLLTFYAQWSKESISWLDEVGPVASAFEGETNISFGMTDCERYIELCQVYEVLPDNFPVIMLFKGEDVSDYTGGRTAPELAKFMNENCGSERGLDGYLEAKAGRIPEADLLVRDFLRSSEKEGVIEKMKRIEGAGFYVKAMERALVNGTEQIMKDLDSMWAVLRGRQSSWAVLDNVKRRYNVFSQFVIHQTDDGESAA